VVRNPFDSISTISERRGLSLPNSIRFYFSLCDTVSELKRAFQPSDIFELRHESFIQDPREFLGQMCRFLGVVASEAYLTDCASIVFAAPRRTRERLAWEKERVETVTRKMALYPFLDGYSYGN
jgi:hypothetical protein